MTISRKSTIPAASSMIELLSYAQVEGHLCGVDVPHWATDTSVEELIEALRLIGDGTWLLDMEDYGDISAQNAADKWLRDFMEGRPVRHPDDPRPQAAGAPTSQADDGGNPDAAVSLAEYLEQLSPEARKRWEKRLASANFASAAHGCIESMAELLATCGVAEEAAFLEYRSPLLHSGQPIDKDLRALASHLLSPENRALLFETIRPYGCDLGRAEKRVRAILVQLKKLPPASAVA